MELVKQPPGSNLCGQACVAMILGTTLPTVIGLMHKRGKTTARDLKNILTKMGYVVDPNKCIMGTPSGPALAICKVHLLGKKLHWVVFKDGDYYDPAGWISTKIFHSGRVTSHFTIGWKTT